MVATIPKTAVLSRKTSALSPFLKGKYLSESHETVGLELALCLLYERLLGSESAFAPFVEILPRLAVPLPMLSLSPWLSGTEVERIDARASYSYLDPSWPYTHDYGMSRAKALAYFHDMGIPILSRTKLFDRTAKQHLSALETAFLTAYTHVSSRDFIIDTYHGVGLVPVADLFNHTEINGVQFESDQEVCEICGVAFLTGHDQDDCRFPHSDTEEESEEEKEEEEDETEDVTDTLDMRTLLPHAVGDEMYNTYGCLPNALLLTRYGFCLDTETDFERYTVDLRFPAERREFFNAFLTANVSGFTKLVQVQVAFERVIQLSAERFSAVIDEDEDEDERERERDEEARGIDALYHLESLLPLPSGCQVAFCSLFSQDTTSERELDSDLVDRDQIHPLFLNSNGRTSVVLYVLIYLVHQCHLHPNTNWDTLKIEKRIQQATLRTLKALWNHQLTSLHITSHLDQALSILSPTSAASYATKASIQHAYQQYASLQLALSTLTDLV